MSTLRVLAQGQITVPREVTEALGLHAGDVVEVNLDEGRIILAPKELSKAEALKGLRELLTRVHARNNDISEEEVWRDVEQAVRETREEERRARTKKPSSRP